MSRQSPAYRALKWTLAVVFIWFGLLKLFGVSPVRDVVLEATPFVGAFPYGFTLLALFEILVGIGLLVRRTSSLSGLLIIIHLSIASLAVLVKPMAWYPVFPRLSLTGEFVAKNAVLIAAAWVISITERKS